MTLLTALALTIALVCGLVWAVLGRTVWWIPAFAFSFLGGYINVGFKIYPPEIGLGLSLVALGSFLVAKPRHYRHRPPLDWSFYALVAYLLGHFSVSCYLTMVAGMPGTGTIVRLYVNSLWGVVFAALFWNYGDLRHFRIALMLATVFCAVRVSMGALAVYAHIPVAIQSTARFVAPANVDLRASALLFIALLVIWFYRRPEKLARFAIGAAYVGTIYLVWIGASRVAALGAVISLLIWAVVQRRRNGLLIGSAGILAAGIIFVGVNYSPGFYDSLPGGVRRSLSAFVVTRDVEEHAGTAVSNAWHFMLLDSARRRWTANLASFTVGNRVEGWDPDYATLPTMDEQADVAARLTRYESAFFTVTATLGIVGLLLFVRALYWLYRPFTRNILRRGIRNRDDALAFVAVQSLLVYVGFSWIAGEYPSSQFVFGVLAAVSFYEGKKAERMGLPGPARGSGHPSGSRPAGDPGSRPGRAR